MTRPASLQCQRGAACPPPYVTSRTSLAFRCNTRPTRPLKQGSLPYDAEIVFQCNGVIKKMYYKFTPSLQLRMLKTKNTITMYILVVKMFFQN